MASNLEPVPVTSQKHDPAWKHCQMFKNGDRVQLKCIYCGKIFKGGGIHRIKEHLAGQKGNASTCLRVQPDVRLLMQESLNGVVVKKRKKQKIAEEISSFNPSTSEVDTFPTHCGLNTEVELLAVPDTVEPISTLLGNREEGTSNRSADHRWEQLHHHPLHAAGFYLNPKFFYGIEGDLHLHIRSLVYDCIEKLVPDPKIQDKIVKETTSYHNAAGDFGRKMAIRARDTLLPAEWWSTYGGGCPNLARLAIRILSQTCSLIGWKPNQIPIEQTHEKKNFLEHQRLRDLLFVQYNLRLRQMVRKNKEQDAVDPISYDNIDIVEDWVTEKELCSEDFGSSDWMTVDPPLGNPMILGPSIDDAEELGAGFDDYEIFNGVKDSEEENGEDNAQPNGASFSECKSGHCK
ncbi:hypothetical protein F0562_026177 [Nyssa sinensis]|uniref:BED-type domain-containing protein n=1 Tax=Nyssa sinensis TaxID=561372 RepID=A0A5J5B8C0_9ASTE|nr:hypothetical protein F0562_026177 [Nyssa sinensis]